MLDGQAPSLLPLGGESRRLLGTTPRHHYHMMVHSEMPTTNSQTRQVMHPDNQSPVVRGIMALCGEVQRSLGQPSLAQLATYPHDFDLLFHLIVMNRCSSLPPESRQAGMAEKLWWPLRPPPPLAAYGLPRVLPAGAAGFP